MPYSKEEQARYQSIRGNISRANKNKRNSYQDFSEIVVGDVVLNTTNRLFKGKVLETDNSTLEVTIERDHDKVRFKTRLWRGLIIREKFDNWRGRKKGGRPKGSKNRRNIYE